MRGAKGWRYAAVSVLGVAGLVSTSVGRPARAACAAPEGPFGTCAPALLGTHPAIPNTLYRVDLSTGSWTQDSNWSGSVPLDLRRADYDSDGTLYAVMKTDPGQRSPRWAAVDLRQRSVSNVSPLPSDFSVVAFAFTPSTNASPRGYLLRVSPEASAPLQLYAIDSAWPLVLTQVATDFPPDHNDSLGLGVSADGGTLYYTTTDAIYEATTPLLEWQQTQALGSLGLTPFAHAAGPAAEAAPRIAILDKTRLYGIDLQTLAVTNRPSQYPNAASAVYRECPVGGVRLVPQSGLVTTEGGGTAEFTAVLTTRPLSDVTVRFKTSNPTEGKVRGRPLVFTYDDWNVPKTVTVVGVPDSVPDGTQPYWITGFPMVSSDPAYDGREVGRIPAVNVDVDPVRPAPAERPSARRIR
jgi:hypothetical protein